MSQNETGMTSIGPIVRDTPAAGQQPGRGEPATAPETGSDSRALVPVTIIDSPQGEGRRQAPRNSALFLAQLIANERQLPQTRERRRAGSQEALAAYGAAAKLVRRRA